MIATLAFVLLAFADPSGGGSVAYLEHCASCHGTDLRGGPNAPSLRGVGAAAVDFSLSTGRMPAAVPWLQVGHRGPQLPQATIDAITAYVTAAAPGGPPIPAVATDGDVERGRERYRERCLHCHGAHAEGGSVGAADWAPPLDRATVRQVGEAVRIGPGQMPAFSAAQLPPRDLDDVVTYLSHERAARGVRGLPFDSGGPVPEGAFGWIAAGVLALWSAAFSITKKERRRE